MPVTACPLDCPDTCSLEVTVEAGRITKVDAAPGNPLTQGFICQKVKRHAERVYGPDRVLSPLVRTGAKGSGEFHAVSWDDALDLVAARFRGALDAGGPGSLVPLLYNSSAGVLASAALTDRLFRRLGAAEVQETICAATAGEAWDEVFGRMLSADPLDVVHAAHVVVWGANPTVSNTHFPPLVQQARAAGARLTVVDPRRTAMAARADRHVAPLPGTDVVLALAMARHLSTQGLLDDAFLDQHASGVEELLAAADRWTLAAAADTCGVAAGDIAAFAEEYAALRPSFLRVGWGIERNRNGGSSYKAVLALPVLAGHFGVTGSGVMTSLSGAVPLSMRRADPEGRAERPERRQLNMNQLGRLLCGELDGPAAAVLFVSGANPAVMSPDQVRVLRGLARDDLFTVVHEQVMTDTAAMADVVLPATTHFEADDLAASYGSFTMQRMRPVIDRVGESRTNDEVAAALADAVGLPGGFVRRRPHDHHRPDRGRRGRCRGRPRVARGRDHRAVRHDVPELRRPAGTPAPAGQRAPGAGVPTSRPRRLPAGVAEPGDQPDHQLDAGRGACRPRRSSRSAPPTPRREALVDGQPVRVWNDQASLVVPCRVDGSLRPGVVVLPKGLWRRHVPGGLTANALVPDTVNDLAGGACFNDARVEVAAVAEAG